MENKLLFGDAERIQHDLFNTVVHMVKTFMQDSKMDQQLMKDITDFIQLLPQKFMLPNGGQSQQAEEDKTVLEGLKRKTGAAFFDFVEVEDVFK